MYIISSVIKHTATVISPNTLPPNNLFTANEISEPYQSVQRHKWIHRLKMTLRITFIKYYNGKVGVERKGKQAIQTTIQLKRRLTCLYPLDVLKKQRIINLLIRGEDFVAFVIKKKSSINTQMRCKFRSTVELPLKMIVHRELKAAKRALR